MLYYVYMGIQILAKKHFGKVKPFKTAKQMERHLKGIANHRRIEVLLKVADRGGLSVDDLCAGAGCSYKTLAAHISKLVQAGLLDKKYLGRAVVHSLTPYGKTFGTFLRTFSHS